METTEQPDVEVATTKLPATVATDLTPTMGTVGGLPLLADAALLRKRLRQYDAARKVLVNWLFEKLIAGVDYVLIHRKYQPEGQREWVECPHRLQRLGRRCETCGGKATLCKPGAEKICGLLRLKPVFLPDREVLEMVAIPGAIALVCQLHDPLGNVVAEGRSIRHWSQDLPRSVWVGGKKVPPGPEHADLNKTVKMCQKSAQIDATLRIAGLSDVFTQDLGDDPNPRDRDDPEGPATDTRPDLTPLPRAVDDPEPAQAPAPTATAPPPQERRAATGPSKTLQEVFALAKQHGITEGAIRIFAARELQIRDLDRHAEDQATLGKLMQHVLQDGQKRRDR